MTAPSYNIFSLLRNAGVGEDIYQSMVASIRRRNIQSLTSFAALVALAAGLLLAFSFTVSASNWYRLTCLSMFAVCLVLAVISRFALRKNPDYAQPMVYLFLAFAFAFGIVLSVMTPNITATTFCVMLVALPLVFVDRPWRMACMLVVVTVAFVLVNSMVKPEAIAYVDSYNAFSFCLVGIVANTLLTRSKLYELMQREWAEKERDSDGLTGLLNKRACQQRIADLLDRPNRCGAFLILDLDDFKVINDSLGHAFGDTVLRLVADELHATFRSSDVIGRFGGDEYVAFLPSLEDDQVLIAKLRGVAGRVRSRVELPEGREPLTMSVGVAYASRVQGGYSELFQCADDAMYVCKQQGKHRFCIAADKPVMGDLYE